MLTAVFHVFYMEMCRYFNLVKFQECLCSHSFCFLSKPLPPVPQTKPNNFSYHVRVSLIGVLTVTRGVVWNVLVPYCIRTVGLNAAWP